MQKSFLNVILDKFSIKYDKIKNKSDCSGCSACVNICPCRSIKFVEDNEGFYYPLIDFDKCNDCGLCEKVCPVIIYRKCSKCASPQVFAAKNRNVDILLKSSSGGLFSVSASWIIEQGGVVYGACYDKKFKVIHSSAETIEECLRFRGSKYVQSDLGDTFIKIRKQLKEKRIVLFTGVPCQVAGFKLFLCKEYENLYTVDLICHGVPSPKIFADYIKFAQQNKQLLDINMRWKGKWEYSEMKLYYTDGSSKIDMLWRDLYAKAIMNRPACTQCEFTHFNRAGDISIADYWGIQKVHPTFYDTKGVSLLLVNSEKGNKLLHGIRENVDLLLSSKDKCLQPRLMFPPKFSPRREEFWKDYAAMDFQPLVKKYYSNTDRFVLFCKRVIKRIVNKFVK